MDNQLRDALARRAFAVTVEVVSPERARPHEEALAPALALARALAAEPRVVGLSVTDRVRSDDDLDPVTVGVALASASGKSPVVHLSGKDRTAADLARSLGRLLEAGLENVLCVTGDRLKQPPTDRPVRFVDSVDAVRVAREFHPRALVAAGVSPFKYTEEETLNQYLKMAKKHAAGADYLITQVGWDMAKLAELARYRAERGLHQPVLANLMVLPLGAARYIHKGSVPGVVVTDDLLALVESEAQATDKGKAARLDRLALQVVGVERLGYGGAQLSGLATADDARRLLDLVDAWRERCPDLESAQVAWAERSRLPGGALARYHRPPGFYVHADLRPAGAEGGQAAPPPEELQRRHARMRRVHDLAFGDRSPLPRLLRPIARRIAPGSAVEGLVARLEERVKAPVFGCQMCGYCRLPETVYVCPETCPKGLANGPCGGSMDNRCEYGDRECVHSVRYRLGKATGELARWATTLVPPVPEPRGGSSWLRHWAGREPAVTRLGDRPSPPGSTGRVG
jgi:methylenetetrahydrofolate reductase (NADPH)